MLTDFSWTGPIEQLLPLSATFPTVSRGLSGIWDGGPCDRMCQPFSLGKHSPSNLSGCDVTALVKQMPLTLRRKLLYHQDDQSRPLIILVCSCALSKIFLIFVLAAPQRSWVWSPAPASWLTATWDSSCRGQTPSSDLLGHHSCAQYTTYLIQTKQAHT